ncbi:MAG: 2-oxo acid dehydrogenase subunit E2, partial [Caldilineaceae bacterium]|nr:2-oxo acid dehydrogenase subunit E2 [Caldilineaceae bacterium]
MAVAVTMPQMGESVVEGTVARWLKAPGDPIAALEPLLEINTDKIDTEVPAPAAGTLLEIVVGEGKTVRAGTVLAYIGAAGEQPVVSAPPAAADVPAQPALQSPVSPPPAGAKPQGRAFISPVVARLAAEHALDLEQIAGTGLGGRITKQDVLAYLARRPAEAAVALPQMAQEPPAALGADEVWQPLTAMRRLIAQHMVQSKRTSPHVTTVFEVDMTAVVQHREAHKAEFAAKGVRLTYTSYFVAAAAQALRIVPEMNARFQEGGEQGGIVQSGIVSFRRVHIGVAVALARGLVVPVIRDADERNLQGLARAVGELADQARTGTLAPDAPAGGTFTITNHGVSGSLIGTPILNQPQAGILGIGAIVKRPVVRSGN